MSLYADYLRERTKDHILERPEGFATYRFVSDKTVYIVDIFVVFNKRKEGIASAMADEIATIAKQRDCVEMIGTVVPSAKGSTNSLRTLLAYGMTLQSASQDLIVFRKDI